MFRLRRRRSPRPDPYYSWPNNPAVEGEFAVEDTADATEHLEVGRRHQLDDVVVVEWTCNYGDGRLHRNVTIGELEDGQAVRVTDYWGEPTTTPNDANH